MPWFVIGILPWLLVWAGTLPRSWRDAPRVANGFAWERFCLVWAAFVFVFFSISGSKLPSYILPMFPALALVLGFELTRLSARALMWIALPLAVGGLQRSLAYAVAWNDAWCRSLRRERRPRRSIERSDPGCSRRSPCSRPAASRRSCGSGTAERGQDARRRRACRSPVSSACNSRSSVTMPSRSFAPPHLSCAKRNARNGGPLDPRFPVFQVRSYDQTLPFYLGRPTPLGRVSRRDGARARRGAGQGIQPGALDRRVATRRRPMRSCRATPSAELARENVPMRVLARDPRRAFWPGDDEKARHDLDRVRAFSSPASC